MNYKASGHIKLFEYTMYDNLLNKYKTIQKLLIKQLKKKILIQKNINICRQKQESDFFWSQ